MEEKSSRLGQRALKSSSGGGRAGDTPSSPPSGTLVTLPCSVMQAWDSSQTQSSGAAMLFTLWRTFSHL